MTTRPISFLFGAGLSRPASLPVTRDITEFVLRGENVCRHTNGRYLIEKHPNPRIDQTRDFLERILLLLQILKTEADLYYFSDRKPNFEDLYFMAQQILGSLTFDEDNPVAHHFARFLDGRLNHILVQDPFTEGLSTRSYPPAQRIRYRHDVSTVAKLLRESCNYMRDVACAMIGQQPKELNYLGWLAEAIEDRTVGQKIFFTLNYDTNLETFLAGRAIRFVDGFGDSVASEGICYFDPSTYEDSSTLHVIKLHGSLNWFTNRVSRGPSDGQLKFIKVLDYQTAAKSFEIDVPIVIVGTHNKPAGYTNPLFEDQHNRFLTSLRATKNLVVCGYSFGDKAINTRLLYWLDQDRNRRMIVIHPNPKECQYGARPAMSRAWEKLELIGQLVAIESGAELVTWATVRGALAGN